MATHEFRIVAAGAVALLAVCPTGASATSAMLQAAFDNCRNQSLAPGDRITACTELLHSNLFWHPVEASFLIDRALAYRDKGDAADEIADVKQALGYKPDYQKALDLRDEIDRQTPGAIPVTP